MDEIQASLSCYESLNKAYALWRGRVARWELPLSDEIDNYFKKEFLTWYRISLELDSMDLIAPLTTVESLLEDWVPADRSTLPTFKTIKATIDKRFNLKLKIEQRLLERRK